MSRNETPRTTWEIFEKWRKLDWYYSKVKEAECLRPDRLLGTHQYVLVRFLIKNGHDVRGMNNDELMGYTEKILWRGYEI